MDNRAIEDGGQRLWLGLRSDLRLRDLSEVNPVPELSRPYTHRLPLEEDFLDFLRLGFGRQKISLQEAMDIKRLIEARLAG